MFKDDRLMSVLSGVVLMVAIGTVVQNSEQLGRFFKGEPSEPELNPDRFEAKANDLATIDVLANDRGLGEDAASRLVITQNPKCGRIFVRQGAVQYLPDGNCFGQQEFGYGLSGTSAEPTTVAVRVMPQGRPTTLARSQPEPAPEPKTEIATVAVPEPDAGARPAPEAPAVVTADDSPPQPAEQPTALARAPQSAPSAPAGLNTDDRPSGSLGFGLLEPVATPEAAGALGGLADTELADRDSGLPLAVEPWTDLAALTPPIAQPYEDRAGLLARSPLPVSKPAEEPEYSTEELALADEIAAAEGPAAPVVLRPRNPGGLAAPASIDATTSRLDIAPLGDGAGPRTLGVPPLQATEAPGEALAALRIDSDADPLVDAPSVTVSVPADLSVASTPAEIGVPSIADLAAPGAGPELGAVASLSGMRPSMALARIEIPRASVPSRVAVDDVALDGAAGSLDRSTALAPAPDLDHSRIALIAPADPVAAIDPARIAPGAALAQEPVAMPKAPEQIDIKQGGGEKVAALRPVEEKCLLPPGVTIDIGPAAMTGIDVYSPCHGDGVALLGYGELRLAIKLDDKGAGRIEVPGFEVSMDAELVFADETTVSFSIPFDGIDKVERVAVTWDMPIRLDLHALEFGADLGDAGHVGPGNARSYGDVRRNGGGFLHSFAPIGGVGQSAQVYTHYLRRGGDNGIVELMIDFADRREAKDGTCGDGGLAKPGFTVVRSTRGVMERPLRRRLAALDCGDAQTAGKDMIRNAVKNMVIAHR